MATLRQVIEGILKSRVSNPGVALAELIGTFFSDGTTSAPGMAFESEPGTGFSRSVLTLSVSVDEVEIARFVNDPANNNVGSLLQGYVRFPSVISPAQITGDQNNYAPTGYASCAAMRLSSDASRNITGLQTPNLLGRMLFVFNIGAQDIVLVNESASSAEASRFLFGANVTLGANEGMGLWYDVTSTRWRSFGKHV